MEDNKPIDLHIWNLRRQGLEPTFIADELLKLWNKNKLSVEDKLSVGRFCLLNGFVLSLVSALRKDLKLAGPICWPLVFHCVVNFEKTFLDAFLVGAAKDQLLTELAVAALERNNPDPRWKKILADASEEKQAALKAKKEKMLAELKIYENESMRPEMLALTSHLALLFPKDDFISALKQRHENLEASENLVRLRERYPAISQKLPAEVAAVSEDFVKALRRQFAKLNLQSAYELSVALSQMGLTELALEALETQKDNWGTRERVIHVEFLLAKANFVEALSKTQEILSVDSGDADAIQSCLYYSAIAYHQLNDDEQAINILKAIAVHDPDYRDVNQLLQAWEQKK